MVGVSRARVEMQLERLEETPPLASMTQNVETRPPFVSVIIPAYNERRRLVSCLEALDHQSYPQSAYEIIVVDNGSDEPAFDLAETFSRVRVAEEATAGSYAARNTGISMAKGDLLAFTDADCVPAADWLQSAVQCLAARPSTTIVAGAIDRPTSAANLLTAAELYDCTFFLRQDVYVTRFGFAVTANLVAPAAAFRTVGLFDSTLKSGGDVDWCRRATASGFILAYAQEVRVRHPLLPNAAAVLKKSRRITDGTVELERRAGTQRQSAMMSIVAELREIAPRWRFFRQQYPSVRRAQRVKVGSLIVAAQCGRAAERLRLRAGGRARRQ